QKVRTRQTGRRSHVSSAHQRSDKKAGAMFHGFVVVMLLGFFVQQLWLISILRKIAMSTTPGLTALQALVTTVQNFASQQSSDLAALTALQNSSASEDPAVLAAVQNLNTALATVQANESNLETLNKNLTAAET